MKSLVVSIDGETCAEILVGMGFHDLGLDEQIGWNYVSTSHFIQTAQTASARGGLYV